MGLAHPLNIPLTSIRLAKDMEDADEIKKIVEYHGPALVKLIAVMDSACPRCDFPFGVRLETLKELMISDGFCSSLKLLKFTPNLETLRIVDDVTNAGRDGEREHGQVTTLISNTSTLDLEDVRLLKLTTLQLQYTVSEEDIRRLVKWMPEVNNVEMFHDSQYAVACQTWENLVRLKIYGDGEARRVDVVSPNITYLLDLQMFDAPDSKLMDISVAHGFLKMGHVLRHVFIRNTQITEAAKKTLHEKYIKIDFGFTDQVNPNNNG